jgi:hypothetical protein
VDPQPVLDHRTPGHRERNRQLCWLAWGITAVYWAATLVALPSHEVAQVWRSVLLTFGGSLMAATSIMTGTVWQAHRNDDNAAEHERLTTTRLDLVRDEMQSALAQCKEAVEAAMTAHEESIVRHLEEQREQIGQMLLDHEQRVIDGVAKALRAVLNGDPTVSDLRR